MHYSFGSFDFDAATGELHRATVEGLRRPVDLRPQTAGVLGMLLRHHGSLVTREALQEEFWPEEPWVARQGLNACVAEIRAALGDRADQPVYVKTHPRRGYSFIAPVEIVGEAVEPPADSARQGSVKGPSGRLRLLFIAAAVLAVGAVLMWPTRPGPAPRESQSSLPRVLVLPPTSLEADSRTESLRLLLADMLIADLAASPRMRVIGRRSSVLLDRTADAPDVLAERVGADFVVDATLSESDDSMVFRYQVLDPESLIVLVSGEERFESVPESSHRERVAAAVHRAMNVESVADVADEVPLRPPDDLLRARYLLDRPGADLGVVRTLLEAALEEDSTYAPTYAALAELGLRSGSPDDALTAAQRALKLDSTAAAAHEVLASLSMHQLDFEAAMSHGEAALRHEPRSTRALTLRGYLHLLHGEPQRAIEDASRALELDPIVPQVQGDAGWIYLYARDWDRARSVCENRLRVFPESRMGRECVLLSAMREGDSETAARMAIALDPAIEATDSAAILRAYWENRLTETTPGTEGSGSGGATSMPRVQALSMLGLGVRALEELRRATDGELSPAFVFAAVDPHLDRLRSEPGWANIASRFPPFSLR